MNPHDWLKNGMPDLPQYSTVYGATDVKVEQISDNVFRAYVTFWSTSNYQESMDYDALEEATETVVYEYLNTVDFTFRSRGYWHEITKIETVDVKLVKEYHVPFSTSD